MKRLIMLILVVAAGTLIGAGSVPPPLGAPTASATNVLYTNNLANPSDMKRIVFDTHWGTHDANYAPLTFHGDHDMNCGGPTTTRDVHEHNAAETVWYCAVANPHFMTGMNSGSYNVISFSPINPASGTVVFPATATTLCWSQNLTDLGGRKWTTVAVISDDRFAANGGDLTYVTPDNALNAGDGTGGAADPAGRIVSGDDFAFVGLKNSVQYFSSMGYQSDFGNLAGVTDKATRYRTCLHENGNGTVSRSQARPGGGTSTVTLPGRFPAGPRVFIIEDDTYNADKAASEGSPPAVSDAYTWHWDDIEVTAGEVGDLPVDPGEVPPPVTYPPSTASQFDALSPARLLDTRASGSTIDGGSSGAGVRPAGSVTQLQLAGRGGVANDVRAASLNLTVVDPSGPGFVTAYPCDATRPTASNINFHEGDIVANAVISDLDVSGRVCFYTSAATHLVVDVNGSFPAASSFRALTPARLADTRPGGATIDGGGSGAGIRPAGSVTEIAVTGRGGVPAGAQDVALNVTVTDTQGDGFGTVFPCGEARPLSSNVNFRAGEVVGHLVVTALGAGGKVCIYTNATTDLVVDVAGWFPAGNSFGGVQPARLLDTRAASATVDGAGSGGGKRGPGATVEVQLGGRAGVPGGAGAAALNVTTVDPESDGFATVYPCGQARPLASNVNYATGAVVPNFAISRLGSGGKVCVYVSSRAHVVVDVMGWFPA